MHILKTDGFSRRIMLNVVAVCILLTGCVTEPITGRRRLIFTPPSVEMILGLQSWTEVLKKEKLSTNTVRTAAVKRVGEIVSRAVNIPDYEWEFQLFQSEQANAFCLPGGKIAVYEGLFEITSNDAELAAVIGHEIAHATARHGGERMTQALAVSRSGGSLLRHQRTIRRKPTTLVACLHRNQYPRTSPALQPSP